MREPTDREIEVELQKMKLERLIFGRHLVVGNGESQEFWRDLKPKASVRRRLRRAFERLWRK